MPRPHVCVHGVLLTLTCEKCETVTGNSQRLVNAPRTASSPTKTNLASISGPPATWNDPDWPSSKRGWLILAFVFGAFVFTLTTLALLIGGSL